MSPRKQELTARSEEPVVGRRDSGVDGKADLLEGKRGLRG